MKRTPKMVQKIKKMDTERLMMLLFLLFMVIISSYAWLTSNTFVKVDVLDIKIETTPGLEISVDAVNWKTTLTREDILTGEEWTDHMNHISGNKEIKPVSTIGETTRRRTS